MKMNNRKFDGAFAEHIEGFIRQKRAFGYGYQEGAYILLRFEEFCKEYFPDSTALSKETGLKWAERRENENGNSQLNRISVIREFGKYMNSIGISAYVIPTNIHSKCWRSKPYIYSDEELAAIFRASDEYPYRPESPILHLVVSVIFRLLYCCGLRPVESRRLHVDDVNLNTGQIRILESKGHKDRIVVMSDDMLLLVRKYHEQVTQKFPKRTYFFHNYFNNGMYSEKWMTLKFNKLLKVAGISNKKCITRGVYSLRHTFATHRLYQWLQEGEDINACLAYLSEYMGHEHISDTAYYIHLVPEFFPQMAKLGFQTRAGILPEVPM